MNPEDTNRKILCDIARCAFEVINNLLRRDRQLASDLRSDTTQSRQVYREESITTEVAVTLQERFPDHVHTVLFTPAEEKQTGADWYWRIETADRAIHARVQAKRVQRSGFGQPDQSGHISLDFKQLDRLRQATSEAENRIPGLQAWLATFAQFRASPPCGRDDLLLCDHHRHIAQCMNQGPSLWIAHVKDIAQLDQREPSVAWIVQRSLRLDCVLPCNVRPELDAGPITKGFELRDGLLPYQECVNIIRDDPSLRTNFQGALQIAI